VLGHLIGEGLLEFAADLIEVVLDLGGGEHILPHDDVHGGNRLFRAASDALGVKP
jgi:hypothetical protein